MSTLVVHHVNQAGMAHAPAAAWILVCIVVGLLYNATAQSPAVPALELLTMPVSRRAIAMVALTTRLAHPSSLIAAGILAVLWRFNIYASQPLSDALTWLAAAATLYLSCWLLGVTVQLINVRTMAPLLMLVLATTALSCLFASDYILNHSSGWSVLVSLVLASLTSVVTLRRIEAVLHLDAHSFEQRRVSHDDRTLAQVPWKSNLQLQVRLLLRNPRARHTLATVGVFGLFGVFLSAVGFMTDTAMFTVMGQSALIAAAGLGYTGHSLRLHSTFFDGLAVWALASTFETARFDIAASSFSMEGSTVGRPLLMNACTGLVLIAPIGVLFGSAELYPAIIGLLGLTGIGCHRLWTECVSRGVERRRHQMCDGFRAK